MPSVHVLAWLIPLLPLLAGLAIGLGLILGHDGKGARTIAKYLSLGGMGLALLLLLLINLQGLLWRLPDRLVLGTWFASGEWRMILELALDPMGLGLALIAGLAMLLTLIFSNRFMHQEPGLQRFLLLQNLFGCGTLLLLLAGDALLAFIGWAIAGASAFLLIGYRLQSQTAGLHLNQAFITNRLGDLSFLLALSLCLHYLDNLSWLEINARAQLLDTLTAGFILAGFLLAVLVRAAQLPFGAWLNRTLDGPLPSTGLIFAALLPQSGVFLLLRLEPMLKTMPQLMWILILSGALTAIYGWLRGLVESDAKAALLHASQSQLGLMVLWCGLGWFELATWHLAGHTLVRLWQCLLLPGLLEMPPLPARAPWLLRRWRWLQGALLQGFWLETLSARLLVRPTLALSQDMQDLDDKVIRRIIGQPLDLNASGSLAQWEEQRHTSRERQRQARGLAGHLLEHLADLLLRFEQQLLLKGSGRGFRKVFLRMGKQLGQLDHFLAQPRYLWLLFTLGLVIIL